MTGFTAPRTAPRARLSKIAALSLWLALGACAKKSPKPLHTEPWLAHPPASALANTDAALPTTRYVLAAPSLINFELSAKRGKVQGRITKLSGELTVVLGALSQSRGQVRVDLSSIALDDDDANGASWLARVQTALGGDAGAAPSATFDLTGFDDVSPEAIEPARAADGGGPPRRVRGTAVGNLLLNGFRVQKRQPLEAEFGFGGDRAVPTQLTIRSRTPLVVSLETHELHLREPTENRERRRNRTAPAPHDVRVTLELHATKE